MLVIAAISISSVCLFFGVLFGFIAASLFSGSKIDSLLTENDELRARIFRLDPIARRELSAPEA